MMKAVIALACIVFITGFVIPEDFLTGQKKFERVRSAINEKQKLIEERLQRKNIAIDELNILIVVYKAEQELNVFAKKKTESTFTLLSTYNICSSSGELGPKRRQGDSQVPEGYYHVDRFNPTSSFYLSLGVSYPNQSDKKKSKYKNLGGDIFIHGSCVTIGCMPMTDDKIKEIYVYALYSKQNGQLNIPVYIFPFKMTKENFDYYKKKYKDSTELLSFWTNLKPGFDKFEAKRKSIEFTIDSQGNYSY